MEYKYNLTPFKFNIDDIKNFYGFEDANIKALEKAFNCIIYAKGEQLTIVTTIDNYDLIEKALDAIAERVNLDEEVDTMFMNELTSRVLNKKPQADKSIKFVTTYNGKVIRAKNDAQSTYYNLLEKNTIIFAMGAAGTGKTYLAVAYAINLLKNKKINKIIITRPIVEAGENLGFLPGELKEKVDPYLVPIYDALHEFVGKEATDKYLDKEIVEIAPLAYMRGRTLNDAFVILDEAQNTTSTQMKMFLTRLGYNCKMVITGDESQVDLKSNMKSGIVIASQLLGGIEDISCIHFESSDVVRHPLVSKIIQAYEEYEDNKKNKEEQK